VVLTVKTMVECRPQRAEKGSGKSKKEMEGGQNVAILERKVRENILRWGRALNCSIQTLMGYVKDLFRRNGSSVLCAHSGIYTWPWVPWCVKESCGEMPRSFFRTDRGSLRP